MVFVGGRKPDGMLFFLETVVTVALRGGPCMGPYAPPQRMGEPCMSGPCLAGSCPAYRLWMAAGGTACTLAATHRGGDGGRWAPLILEGDAYGRRIAKWMYIQTHC